ncbi:MAG: hypothetical protein Q9182_003409 [Xanthomendoza sp. 2 TL-2023]
MTQRDTLECFHEPFGDAFYYGPERLGSRYEDDLDGREASGFTQSTYQTILDRISRASEGKRIFIKDMAYYLIPPDAKPSSIAPSLGRVKRGVGTCEAALNGATDGATTQAPYPYHTDAEPNNPTVIPRAILGKFHFAFLIRHPRSSIPSYYRCCKPPLDKVTGWYTFQPNEAGYDELRRLFDYLRSIGQVASAPGPASTGAAATGEAGRGVEVCVLDADDLLDHPAEVVEAFCKSVGIEYTPGMLDWSTEADQQQAREAFSKWNGWHDDALNSQDLKPRQHKKKVKSVEDEDKEWKEKYGEDAAKVIRETVDKNIEDYEYLKGFAMKF